MEKLKSDNHQTNLINFHETTIKGSGKKFLPLIPLRMLYHRPDGIYASVNLTWLIEVYYFEN